MTRGKRPSFGPLIFFAVAFALGLYFTFAAVQGDFGLFRRAEINAEARDLRTQLGQVSADVAWPAPDRGLAHRHQFDAIYGSRGSETLIRSAKTKQIARPLGWSGADHGGFALIP